MIFGDSFSSVQIQSNRPDDIYLLEFTAKTGKDMSKLRRNSKKTQLMMADCSFYLSCQKGIYLTALDKAKRQWLAENSKAIFKCYDWQDTQDLLPLYDEFSRSYNTTAAGGNTSLMSSQEE